MGTSIKVNYEDLVNAYWNNLTTVLRGFNIGADLEFLDAWVPEDDVRRGLLSMLEAAQDAGLETITVSLGADTLSKVGPDELLWAAGGLGIVHAEQRGAELDLSVTFSHQSGEATGDANTLQPPPAANFRLGESARTEANFRAESRSTDKTGTLPSGYASALSELVSDSPHQGQVLQEHGYEAISVSDAGVELTALVDPRNHRIRNACFDGRVSDEQRRLLELLCRSIEGRPIQDASDHGAMYLEYRMRTVDGNRCLPGITMPENVSSRFDLPVRLVRGLLATYRARTGYEQTQNFYDPLPSLHWRQLSEQDRISVIQKAIDSHAEGQGVQVVRLEGLQRFIVQFNGISSRSGSSLLNLEKHVKAVVEPTLHLYLQPRVDQNKLRRLNDKTAQG